MTVYWYRDRHSGRSECIMTGKGRGMVEEEGSIVSAVRAQHSADLRGILGRLLRIGLTISICIVNSSAYLQCCYNRNKDRGCRISVNFYYRLIGEKKGATGKCCYTRGCLYSTSCCIWTRL